MSQCILVAGIGNIFLKDDGFGVEVAKRLTIDEFPDGVRVNLRLLESQAFPSGVVLMRYAPERPAK